MELLKGILFLYLCLVGFCVVSFIIGCIGCTTEKEVRQAWEGAFLFCRFLHGWLLVPMDILLIAVVFYYIEFLKMILIVFAVVWCIGFIPFVSNCDFPLDIIIEHNRKKKAKRKRELAKLNKALNNVIIDESKMPEQGMLKNSSEMSGDYFFNYVSAFLGDKRTIGKAGWIKANKYNSEGLPVYDDRIAIIGIKATYAVSVYTLSFNIKLFNQGKCSTDDITKTSNFFANNVPDTFTYVVNSEVYSVLPTSLPTEFSESFEELVRKYINAFGEERIKVISYEQTKQYV